MLNMNQRQYIKLGNNIAVDPCFIFCVNLSSWPYLNVKIKDIFDERSELTNVNRRSTPEGAKVNGSQEHTE